MRILAIDHGLRRLGFAISDDGHTYAQPLPQAEVSTNNSDVKLALAVIEKYKPDKVVIGYPLGLENKQTAQSKLVQSFINKLATLTVAELTTWNESYSSAEALRLNKLKGSRNKDSESARIILQEYLDFINSGI